MSVVIEIAGREALPVWTLPYVTSWRLSPDMLVRNLVGCDFGTAYPHYFFPTAFNLDEHGKPSPLSPAQWSGTHNLLGKLHQGLKDEKQRKDKERIEWEMQSIAILLIDETCYVWRDEFESYYERLIDCSKNKENIELQFNPKLPREYALKLKELHAEKTLEKPDISSLKNSPVLPETMKSVALKAEDNMFNQPLSSHHKLDPRIRFRHKFGETLSITELMQHWQSNVNFINEFAFAKKIRPNLDNREARVEIKNGKRIFSFISLPTDGQDCIVEDVDDCPQYTELPDNTYFYWTDILSYEEAHPEIKNRILELDEERSKEDNTKGNNERVSTPSNKGDGEPVEKIEPSINQNPWEISDPKDPKPIHDWYIPARYFARQLVKKDSTLLTKREKLCQKIVMSLDGVGIKKRGGINPFNYTTIKKALTNVIL